MTTNNDFTLSRMDLFRITFLTLLLPLPIIWILLKLNPMTLIEGANEASIWIDFGGSYIGGILGGAISILILNRTLQQTAVLHRDLKVLQLNTIKYTQQQEWFTGFKEKLADNLKAIDLYVLNTVVSCLSMKNFDYAQTLLTEVNKQLEQQNMTSAFLFPSSTLHKEEKEYIKSMQIVYWEYSALIKDLLYYIPMAEAMEKGSILTYEMLLDYTMTQYDYLEATADTDTQKNNLCSEILELEPDCNIAESLRSMVEKRLTLRTQLYTLKTELAQKSTELIIFEEKQLNAMLQDNM